MCVCVCGLDLVWKHVRLMHSKLNVIGNSPYSIQPFHRSGPAQTLCLLSYQQLCVVVGHHAGFTDQSLILQLMAGHLLVEILQAHQEHPMSKPVTPETVYVTVNDKMSHT